MPREPNEEKRQRYRKLISKAYNQLKEEGHDHIWLTLLRKKIEDLTGENFSTSKLKYWLENHFQEEGKVRLKKATIDKSSKVIFRTKDNGNEKVKVSVGMFENKLPYIRLVEWY